MLYYYKMAHILCHTLDKVRYFRNLLITEDTRIRILIGNDRVIHTLQLALEDMKGVPVNQLAIIQEYVPPKLVDSGKVIKGDPILVYIRRLHDKFADSLMEEYGDCEVIVFEKDPLL
jgi:hypothetical protein